MPDSANSADASDSSEEAGAWSRSEIEAAIAGLDRATRKFTSRVDELSREPAPAYPSAPAPAVAPAPAHIAAGLATAATTRPGPPRAPLYPRPERPSFDQQMQDAEQAAREYLDQAKRRADSLVRSMIGAVEREAAEIRRDAEEGIRERWSAVEIEADRYLDDARKVAEGMVAERQSVIGTLSDGIVGRAESLTTGLEDAERIQAQFDQFVRALAATSQRIADEASGESETEIASLAEHHDGARGDALAA